MMVYIVQQSESRSLLKLNANPKNIGLGELPGQWANSVVVSDSDGARHDQSGSSDYCW